MQTVTTHYINGTFVESLGSEVMDIIKPTNRQVIARVTMADEQDTKRAIAAAKSAFITFGRSPGKSAHRFCADCIRRLLRALTS